jgi:CBS domain-containing protein
MKIKNIMTTDVQSCSPATSLDKIASMMWEHNCGSIAVVSDERKPVGMVTDRDIAMCCTLNHKAPWELESSTVIGNRELFSCSQDDDVATALEIMQENKVRRLPVTDSDGFLSGILTIDDIVAFSDKRKLAKFISYDATMDTLKAFSRH